MFTLWRTLIVVSILVMLKAELALGCSSCGSGGADPLILSPFEDLKVMAQWTDQRGFRDITSDGQEIRSFGAERKHIWTTAVAFRLHQRAFASLTIPWQENHRHGASRSGFGDPLLTVRGNLLMQNMAQPWRPQIQLLAAHKAARSRSMREAERMDALDVRSNGFDESLLGLDIWFGMTGVLAGASYMWVAPSSLDDSLGRLDKRAEHRSVATVGYMWPNQLSLVGGLRYRSHDGLEISGQRAAGSELKEGAWFLTAETRLPGSFNYRLTISESGGALSKQNTSQFFAVSLALIGRIL